MPKPHFASATSNKNNAKATRGKLALISLSDKTGVEDFASKLINLGYEIISTDGTKSFLEKNGIPVTSVENITKFPECFGGRVKTMHPLILGGLLFRRNDDDDVSQAKELNIKPIDMVVINLYPFEETALRLRSGQATKEGVTEEELIEQIDIGGPTMLRSAAKNYSDVTVICDINDYSKVIDEIEKNGDTTIELRRKLALKVFERTAEYDKVIASTLNEGDEENLALTNELKLRYGENPHQWGKYFDISGHGRRWRVLQEEKQMSYLNILDSDGAINLVCEFENPTAACIKHANPSGVASHSNISEAFQRSYDADRLSAFGVIVSLNRECPKEVVEKIIDQKIFAEVLIAPSFSADALELLKGKPKIRVIKCACPSKKDDVTYRSMLGGILVQDTDTKVITVDDLTCVTDAKPSNKQVADLLFAWRVVKHAKSNAIVFAKDKVTTGIGCGQTSRVDSTIIAARRAGDRSKGSVMASDAFFPFPDSIEAAAENGISAIIQPLLDYRLPGLPMNVGVPDSRPSFL